MLKPENQKEQQMYGILGPEDFEAWKLIKLKKAHQLLISQAKKNLRTNPNYKRLLKDLRLTTEEYKTIRQTRRVIKRKIQELIEEEVNNLKGVR